MIIKLYNNKSSNNVINKVLEYKRDIDCKLKSKEDLYNIELVLKYKIDDGIDYLYIPELQRYYFIKNIASKGKIWFVTCECDLLETYKVNILNSKGYITSQEHFFNKYNTDIDYIEDSRKKSSVFYSDIVIKIKDTYIMTALRGV